MKRHGLTIGIAGLTLVLIIGIFFGFYWYLNYQYIPSGLTMDGYDHYASITPHHQYVIHYPKCDDYACVTLYEDIANHMVETMEDNGSTRQSVLIDIQCINPSYGLMHITNQLNHDSTSVFVDLTTHSIDHTINFSEDFLRMLRADFLQVARSDDRYWNVAYTSDFANGLTMDNLVETITWDNPYMVFTIDLGYGELSVSKDMRYFIDALNMDLTIESYEKTIRYQSTRYIDSTRSSIVLMVVPGMNRSLDDQWIELLDHYGASATFYTYGYAMEGNDDLILSGYNHNLQLGSLGMYGSIMDLSDQKADEEIYGPLRIVESMTNHEATMESFLDINHTVDASNYPLDVITVDSIVYTKDELMDVIHSSNGSTILLAVDNNEILLNAMKDLIPSMMDQGYQWINVSEYLTMH